VGRAVGSGRCGEEKVVIIIIIIIIVAAVGTTRERVEQTLVELVRVVLMSVSARGVRRSETLFLQVVVVVVWWWRCA